jgi:hypothetical protein
VAYQFSTRGGTQVIVPLRKNGKPNPTVLILEYFIEKDLERRERLREALELQGHFLLQEGQEYFKGKRLQKVYSTIFIDFGEEEPTFSKELLE